MKNEKTQICENYQEIMIVDLENVDLQKEDKRFYEVFCPVCNSRKNVEYEKVFIFGENNHVIMSEDTVSRLEEEKKLLKKIIRKKESTKDCVQEILEDGTNAIIF